MFLSEVFHLQSVVALISTRNLIVKKSISPNHDNSHGKLFFFLSKVLTSDTFEGLKTVTVTKNVLLKMKNVELKIKMVEKRN